MDFLYFLFDNFSIPKKIKKSETKIMGNKIKEEEIIEFIDEELKFIKRETIIETKITKGIATLLFILF